MKNPFFKNFGPFKIDMLLKKVSVSNPENFKTDKIFDINLIVVSENIITLKPIKKVINLVK